MADERNERVHELLPSAYEELKRLAGHYLRPESATQTLDPTALVHEAFLKLQGFSRLDVRGRTHLIALTAVAMRQILIDHVRARRALKRGGDWHRVTLDTAAIFESRSGASDVENVEAALAKLEVLDPQEARIVELKFFGGLTEAEIGEEMHRSERWVRLHWAHARGWMRRELAKE